MSWVQEELPGDWTDRPRTKALPGPKCLERTVGSPGTEVDEN